MSGAGPIRECFTSTGPDYTGPAEAAAKRAAAAEVVYLVGATPDDMPSGTNSAGIRQVRATRRAHESASHARAGRRRIEEGGTFLLFNDGWNASGNLGQTHGYMVMAADAAFIPEGVSCTWRVKEREDVGHRRS